MSRRKAAGLDINGWRDHVARNWTTFPGEDERIGGVHVRAAGPLGSVVRIGDERTGRWIGGFPADIAPHGLGGGWGAIGDESRRIQLRALLEGVSGGPQQLAAAFSDLARGAAHTVLAIEDSPETTETLQERLLAGLSQARMRNAALVWRTVLGILYAIDAGMIEEECTVGIVSHASSGLSVQKLRVRRAGTLRDVLAPERRNAAQMLGCSIGLRDLVERVRHRVIGDNGGNGRAANLAMARTVGRLALGLRCDREILRLPNGDWEEIALAGAGDLPAFTMDGPFPSLGDCDQVFLETIAEGDVRSHLATLITDLKIGDLQTLPPDAVAKGALVAACRMSDGDPVYFDFLPRISTIVSSNGRAQNFDLIDESETLEAGHIYRSPRPAVFAIPKGVDEIPVYLRKDAAPHPRKALVKLDVALKKETPVSVWVEQKPAAGRARIVLEVPSLARSITIDWENAEDDERAWDDIITALETPPPAFPDRLVLKCGMHPWRDSSGAPGMFTLLDQMESNGVSDWEPYARKAAARPYQEYCVSSDGHLPAEVSDDAVRQLDMLTHAALTVTAERLTSRPAQGIRDNAALKFLTWQFRRCPTEVSEWLATCIENHAGTIGTHPFIWHQSNWVLIYQGFSRTVRDAALEERVLRAVLRRGIERWSYRAESACVALMLSRSETAPMLLERQDVDEIGQRAVIEFREELGGHYTRFNYAPFLVGGLLRWRLKEPRALLTGNDTLADSLFEVIEAARQDLMSRRRVDEAFARRREKYVPILDDLLKYLRGEGGNPNLLLDLYDAY
ncbi:hypothetical protein [Rhodovulum marinum]|uniref:Uncharacterized protein n=1 Tax=Rhodovulum marinum TaxID=320662 RepID=A0A4R2PYM7_9RHOB|nr:hypothetical protein [Rhodovulum marinum]TCP41363.1 hypothetical protein EV662_105109 [Rhodovulum marinum]